VLRGAIAQSAWGLDYKLYDQGSGVRFLEGTRELFLKTKGLTAEFTQPMGTCISFLGNKSIGLVADRLSLSSLPKLRMHGVLPPLS